MCNGSLEVGRLPLSQRHEFVQPRLKKATAGPEDMNNYRLISNLTFISKVMEKQVCRQIAAFLEENKLLPTMQSAYRRYHSTETAVLKIASDILRTADRGDVTFFASWTCSPLSTRLTMISWSIVLKGHLVYVDWKIQDTYKEVRWKVFLPTTPT